MNETLHENCLCYVPGEIVVIRPTGGGEAAPVASTSRTVGSLVHVAEFSRSRIRIELHAVVPGSELWQLESVRKADSNAIASLNYLGESAASWYDFFGFDRSAAIGPVADNKWHIKSLERRIHQGWPSTQEAGSLYVLVVDVRRDHCENVMRAVAQGANSGPHKPNVIVLGTCLVESGRSLATIHDYSLLLLTAAASTPAPIAAVNMSIDFGRACDQGRAHANGVSTVCLSFPFFERVLVEARALMRDANCIPAFFAAAGNRIANAPRWRMAYPAVRPEVIAVTSAAPDAGGMRLSSLVDCPAVHQFKPCFAVPASEFKGSDVALPETTSMATGWASGRYAAIASGAGARLLCAPALAKVAQLQAEAKRRPILEGKKYWAMPSADLIPAILSDFPDRSAFQSLLAELNAQFENNEFIVTGSFAAVFTLLSHYQIESWKPLREMSPAFGDVDLVVAAPLDDQDAAACRIRIREWLATWSSSDHAIDLAYRDDAVSLPTMAQVVVPAAQLAITQDGIVDGHGGLQDIRDGVLRALIPDQEVWRDNPAYRIGLSGPVHGILVWLNTSLLLNLASLQLSKVNARQPKSIVFEQKAVELIAERLNGPVVVSDSSFIYADRQRKLRPRLDRTFRLVRMAEYWGLDVSIHKEFALIIEKTFLTQASGGGRRIIG